MKKKLLYIILDGAGDVEYREFDWATPLEIAEIPNMDKLISLGQGGIMYPIAENIAPESDESMISLLGNDPFKVHRGRGPLEAYGADVKFNPGEIVLRCNFAYVKDNEAVDVQAGADLKPIEVKHIVKKLSEIKEVLGYRVRFVPTIGYRAVFIISGKNLSPKISNTHPGYEVVKNYISSANPRNKPLKVNKAVPLDGSREAFITAAVVNEFTELSKRILGDLEINLKRKQEGLSPVNYILMRGAGNALPPLKKLRGKWAIIGHMPVEKAIATLSGMTVLKRPKTNKALLNTLLKNWNKFNEFYFEIKSPDKYAHRGDLHGKKKALEDIDREFIGPLLDKIDLKDVVICITADHSTPCRIHAHSKDPVPVLIYSSRLKADAVVKFGEKFCINGKHHFIKGGVELFNILMKELGR